MNWQERTATIQPGDVFVKDWGDKQLVHVMLPRPKGVKQKYMILESGNCDSTWTTLRSRYGNTTTDRRWRYVGTVPADHLLKLMVYKTLRQGD